MKTNNSSLVCCNNHTFDYTKKGSINLIKANNYKASNIYTKELFINRRNFINNNFYKEISFSQNIKEDIKKLVFSSLREITKEEYPWGILVGIRPSKIALKYLEEGKSEEEIIEIFKTKHLASEEKARLCIDVAKKEEQFVNNDSKNIAVYIGMAF